MTIAIVWFRQDLRLEDHPALLHAIETHSHILPLYILDDKKNGLGEAQTWWLHHSLERLMRDLYEKLGLKLILRRGNPLEIILDLAKKNSIEHVYWNRCYEPEQITRDTHIKTTLQKNQNIAVSSFNASLLNEPWTIKNKQGDFFKVFTPYWKTCRQILTVPALKKPIRRPCSLDIETDALHDWSLLPHLNWAADFKNHWTPGEQGAHIRLHHFLTQHLDGYQSKRDIPEKRGTSYLSPHLHFGEISPWSILRALDAVKNDRKYDPASAERFLSEIGWREFSYYLLYHFPQLPHQNFKKEFDDFPWENDPQLLKYWQKGMTGYPLVDAGMRELWATGYMHNRVRMVVASFLTKGLMIDWRLGAAWFLDTLLDADLANNSASWQWVAGCGADAAPYFRIFNPVLQSQKFDPDGTYIRQWVPELRALDHKKIHAPWESDDAISIYRKTSYPKPIINHNASRAKALSYYQQIKHRIAP